MNMFIQMIEAVVAMLTESKKPYTNKYADIETRTSARGYYALRKTRYGSKLVKADRSKPIDVSAYYLEPIVGMRNPEKRRGRRAIKLLKQGA